MNRAFRDTAPPEPGRTLPQPLPWDEPGWFARVDSWVGDELDQLGLKRDGELALVRTRPWAAVAKIATTAGDVWFKEPAPSLGFEPALTLAVSSQWPNFTPEVLATEQTWLLTRDAGPPLRALRKHTDPRPSWDELLPRYAELQIGLTENVAELLELGVPDKRPRTMSADYPRLVEQVAALATVNVKRLKALAPQLESLTEALADAVPATLIHEEFHEANVFVRNGRARLLDWAEAAVSHPFAGLVNTLRDIAYRRRLKPNGREMLRLRSVYLEPWTRFAPAGELNELFAQGYALGALCRALTWERLLATQTAAVRTEYSRNAMVWLDIIFRECIEGEIRLGA